MKPLYTPEEFDNAKSLDLLPCECIICNNAYFKKKRVILQYPDTKGYCSHKCQGTGKKKKKLPRYCENCEKFHFGNYASGRFCSIECSKGFSTKNKREEINYKVSQKLKGIIFKRENKEDKPEKIFIIPIYEKECIVCRNIFKSKSKTCSKICRHILTGLNQKGKRKKSGNARKKGSGGLREGGGRSKVFEYISPIAGIIKINKEEIRVAKILDKLNLKWKRNFDGFVYTTLNGEIRKYYPDFYIENFDIYVEFKGWVTPEMEHKMKDAENKNKLKLIIIYSENKRYRNLGLCIKDIEVDHNKLLNNLNSH